MGKKDGEAVVLLVDEVIEGRRFAAGDQIGVMRGGRVEAYEEASPVTRGHVEARLRFRRAALRSDVDTAAYRGASEASRMQGTSRDPGGSKQLGGGTKVTVLPEGFPGLTALQAAGVDSYETLAGVEDFQSIGGIGEKAAKEIGEALRAEGFPG